MIETLRFITGDQLSHDVSALQGCDPAADVIFMAEAASETNSVKHHKQKIVLVLSAMRHFADELRARGFAVDYVNFEDAVNTGDLFQELQRAVGRHKPKQIVMTEPSEWRVWDRFSHWNDDHDIPLLMREDDRFFCSRAEFARWSEGRKQLRMEFFYRDMRRKTGLLMEGEDPEGGQWNYDAENRKRLPAGLSVPAIISHQPDAITQDVISLVHRHFAENFGSLENFQWAVTRQGALAALNEFTAQRLASFGDHQDAMSEKDDFLFHAVLSPYLNIGLLTAREVCAAAEKAYRSGQAPLNAVEGFIRQIIGWREYVRGVYWLKMPDYAQTNFLDAKRKLPWFYWSGETKMKCVSTCVKATDRNAYAHHIQRLMVTGNFALLAGIAPAEIEEWYLIVYADAFDWVELPNVHGMVMFADGGMLASKPYAASGAYINKMSDYCKSCHYDVALKSGPRACPFNYLYWNFLIENAGKLKQNPRLAMPYKTIERMDEGKIKTIKQDAARFFAEIDSA